MAQAQAQAQTQAQAQEQAQAQTQAQAQAQTQCWPDTATKKTWLGLHHSDQNNKTFQKGCLLVVNLLTITSTLYTSTTTRGSIHHA